jgi:hypothetical protein
VLCVRSPSLKTLGQKLKSTPFWALKDHPDVKKVLDKVRTDAAAGLAQAQKELGFDPVETLAGVEGEVVIALGGLEALATALGESLSVGQMPQNFNTENVPLLIAADAGGYAPQLHERLEKLMAFAVKQGAKKETVDFKGGKITRLTESHEKAKDGDGAEAKGKKGDDEGDSKKKSSSDKPEKPEKPGNEKKGGSDFVARGAADPSALAADDDDDKDGKDDKDDADEKDDKDEKKDDDVEEAAQPPVNVYFGELGSRVYVSTSRAMLEKCMQKPDEPPAQGSGVHAELQRDLSPDGHGGPLLLRQREAVHDVRGQRPQHHVFRLFLAENRGTHLREEPQYAGYRVQSRALGDSRNGLRP